MRSSANLFVCVRSVYLDKRSRLPGPSCPTTVSTGLNDFDRLGSTLVEVFVRKGGSCVASTRVSPVRPGRGSRLQRLGGPSRGLTALLPSRHRIPLLNSRQTSPYLAFCPEGTQVVPSLASAQSLLTGARPHPSFARHAALRSVDSEQVDPQPKLASVRLLSDNPRRPPGRYDPVSCHWYVRVLRPGQRKLVSHLFVLSAHVRLLLSYRLGRPFPLQGPHQLWPMDGQRP